MSIQTNITEIQKRIKPHSITLVAVTKNRTVEEIKEAIRAGITDIGENRLQEAKEKLPQLPTNITKHFIGHLQTNKVRDVVALFDVIQSVDSLKLAEKIDTECKKIGKGIPILIEVNTSREPQKSGIAPEAVQALIEKIATFENIRVKGLMTIAIDSEDSEKIRACFRELKTLFDTIARQKIPNVEMRWLSMGMSEDYKIAIEEGANMVRVGRVIFENK